MKTVMKKMFCLLLVAVLLVSAVPVAFAEGGAVCKKDGCDHKGEAASRQPDYDVAPTCTEAGKIGYYCQGGHKVYAEGEAALDHDLDNGVITKEPTCKTLGKKTYTCKRGCGFTQVEDVPAVSHTYVDANCNDPKTCSACGHVKEGSEAVGHTWDPATCTTPKTCSVCDETEGEKLGHSYGTGSICATCKNCKLCNETINESADHALSCKLNPNYESTCNKCGEKYVTAEGHDTADCKVCLVCYEKGDIVKQHTTAAHCEKCGNTDGTHKQTCSKYQSTGNATVKVHVRLYTSNVHTDTVELVTYKDSSSAKIYASVANHEDLIRSKLAAKYPGYSWGGSVYDDPGKDEEMSEAIGNGTTVYINAYSAEDMVWIYVHNSRTMEPIRIVQLHGVKKGETVTKSEVKSAVSKYYNVSSMSMYTEQDWEDYVDGKSVESVSSIYVPKTESYCIIDVKISGTAKSTSGSSYTADSSNPKTGDAIFAPAMIMGLSASALAVVYFLNKKRAF